MYIEMHFGISTMQSEIKKTVGMVKCLLKKEFLLYVVYLFFLNLNAFIYE